MQRLMCVWLPCFSTDRLERKQGNVKAPPDTALVIFAPGKGGNLLAAVNARAQAAGLRPGMFLTDAQAIDPSLIAVACDPAAELAELKYLTRACRRYAPWTGIDLPDGLWINITGAAHLFGGEETLLQTVAARFQKAGYAVRAAIAGTHRAAWGMARYGGEPFASIKPGAEAERLPALSVRALGIDADKAMMLEHLGLKQIGQLSALPRAGLRARFGADVSARIDQMYGHAGRASLPYEPIYARRMDFAEPVTTVVALEEAARLLIEQLTAQLGSEGKGARLFSFIMFDTQGGCADLALALSRPSHEPRHVTRLLHERFAALEGRFDETREFDAAMLRASRVEAISAAQADLTAADAEDSHEGLHLLFDRLTARLGNKAVCRFANRESHIPERASISLPILEDSNPLVCTLAAQRPLLLLPRAEPMAVIAGLPDYPPRRFTWRRQSPHEVVRAEGPERIEAEWWREGEESVPLRDYYILENEEGRRFWVYREGVYGESCESQRWFMHGLFA